MIESIQFQNFKVLKNATLKLRPFNVIIGPNGSGKSTVFRALEELTDQLQPNPFRLFTAGTKSGSVVVKLSWKVDIGQLDYLTRWELNGQQTRELKVNGVSNQEQNQVYGRQVTNLLTSTKVFAFEANKIAGSAELQPNSQLEKNGANLVAALDNLRDVNEEAFNELKDELRGWLPEFDSIVFETPFAHKRALKLRQKIGQNTIPAADLSEGTLIALALLLIAHNPNPPVLICLEEPDRGLHPRLLRDVRDALYRLSYPEQFGLKRNPVQVIATTHSPYFLDLFKDHPEEIIVAEKHADGTAGFKSLADDPDLKEVIGSAPLGEVWYSGLLGGVPILK